MTDDPGRSPKVRSIRAAIAGHDVGGLPGPGKTLTIDRCSACPFSAEVRDAGTARLDVCQASRWVEGRPRPRVIPAPTFQSGPPPGWCPLRAGPVTLEVKP